MPIITVDTREHYISKIKDIILEYPDPANCPMFKFECLGLNLGDYKLENVVTLGIERKNISDFCGTYTKLKNRLQNMRLHYDNVGLLLEGAYTISNGMVHVLEGNKIVPRMHYSTFCNFLTHQTSIGTWLFNTMSFEESIYRIINVCNYLPKLELPEPSSKCKNISELFVQLPGIGPQKLDKLRKEYSSPRDALNGELPKKTTKFLEEW